jgi:hypothetical protein
MSVIERPEQAVAWELRGAWASGKILVFSLSERCEPQRVEGRVRRVSPTGAFVVIEERTTAGFGRRWHVPTVDVLATLSPHYSMEAAA